MRFPNNPERVKLIIRSSFMFLKKFYIFNSVVLVLFTILTTSCGGSWVDVQQVIFFTSEECTEKDLEIKKSDDLQKLIFKETCSRIGKAYSGNVRCKNKSLQVKCE